MVYARTARVGLTGSWKIACLNSESWWVDALAHSRPFGKLMYALSISLLLPIEDSILVFRKHFLLAGHRGIPSLYRFRGFRMAVPL